MIICNKLSETSFKIKIFRQSSKESDVGVGGLTCGAVVARPVGITAAGPRLCQESSMSGALVHAGGPGALASWSAPTHKAVALSLDAHPSARACGVQAVHCTKGSNREPMLDTVHLLLPLRLNTLLKPKPCQSAFAFPEEMIKRTK